MKCNPCIWIIKQKVYSTYIPTFKHTELGVRLIPTPPQMYTEVRETDPKKLEILSNFYFNICVRPFKGPLINSCVVFTL